ncbi:hypothetical protein MMC29_006630 [Sticta canariensis]|nr:hypothetical protein [Sticta canariensis]
MPQQLRPENSDGSQRQARGMGQAKKPLPGLPRGWSRVCHETGLFLRSIGLGILVTAFQGFFTNNFLEPEKVAIRQSRVTSLLRALIHLLPLGIATFEITLNWKGHFVGRHFDKQNYLQFAAKAHEIFIQASIATIILSYTRYQISVGKGMPFGAVLGALQFLQVSYLWSAELWSAIISHNFHLKKKLCFTILIIISVTVAATAGPSSANLMIARQGIWPEKSSYLAVNATFEDIWPDRLDDEKISSDCRTVRVGYHPKSLDSAVLCPHGDINRLLEDKRYLTILKTYDITNRQGVILEHPNSLFARILLTSTCFDLVKDQVCSTIPQSAFVGGLGQDAAAHVKEETSQALQGYHILAENYYQPYTAASCVTDTVQNSSDEAALRFARFLETGSELERGREIISVPALTKSQSTYNIPGSRSRFRIDWVYLPQEIFGTGVPGAIIVHPHNSNDSSYKITTCTLNAGWGSSSIFNDAIAGNVVNSHITQTPPSWDLAFYADAYGYAFSTSPIFDKRSNFSYPQLLINISKSWMEFLNPTLILPDNSTDEAVSAILSQLPFEPQEYQIAHLLNFLLASALADTGREHDAKIFENRARASKSCENCLVFEIENSMYGWQYAARETTTKLAIAVMLTYSFLVLAHILYSTISGVSSTAWDSTAEMVALAMNSSPTEALHNTCAGIVGKKAYQTHVRVMKTSEKHLELVFGEVKDPNADITKLVKNEKYGGIASQGGKEDKDELSMLEGQEEIRKRGWLKHG